VHPAGGQVRQSRVRPADAGQAGLGTAAGALLRRPGPPSGLHRPISAALPPRGDPDDLQRDLGPLPRRLARQPRPTELPRRAADAAGSRRLAGAARPVAARAAATGRRPPARPRPARLPVLHRQLSDARRRRAQGELHAHNSSGLGARFRLRARPAPASHSAGRCRCPGRLGAPRAAVPGVLIAVTAVLFTCAGQRVDIVDAFNRAGATTVAADVNALAPALYRAHHHVLVPKVADDAYLPALRTLVEQYDVKVIVPLTDLDQVTLAESR